MKNLSVICAGYICGDQGDHKNYQDRLRLHIPTPVKNFNITAEDYGDIMFRFLFDDKEAYLDAAIGANVTNDIIHWLESISLGYYETLFLIDEEGPLTMLRYQTARNTDIGRFSILSSDGNDKICKTFKETGETQIICDILISAKEFVEKFWEALDNTLQKISDDRFESINAHAPIRTSEIIKKFLTTK